MKSLRNVGFVIIVVGLLSSFGIMASTTSAIGGLSDLLFTLRFYAWVALPFIVLLGLNYYLHRKVFSNALHVAFLITAILLVVSSVFIYWAAIFDSESSTSALVFVFIPLYALVAIALTYGVIWLLSKSVFRPKA